MASRIFGSGIKRREDPRLLTGQGKYTDDFVLPGMVHMSVVRSPYAHATITSIDVSAALELPGVYGTLTGDEVAILTDPFFQIAAPPGGAAIWKNGSVRIATSSPVSVP